MESWVRRTNTAAAILLILVAVICAVLSRSAPDIYLKFYVNETAVLSSRLGPKFGLSYLFAITLTVAAAIHAHHACRPFKLALALSNSNPRPLRIVYMYAVLPSIHACVLVGVARVQDAWCVIAAVLLMIQIVTHLWIVEVTRHKSIAAALTTGLNLVLYLAFWILVWVASTRENVVALALFCASVTLTVVTHVYIGCCSSPRAWTEDVVREIAFVACFVGIQLLCIVGWTASHSTLSKQTTSAVAWTVCGVYIMFVTYLATTAPKKVVVPCETIRPARIRIDDEDDEYSENNAADDEILQESSGY